MTLSFDWTKVDVVFSLIKEKAKTSTAGHSGTTGNGLLFPMKQTKKEKNGKTQNNGFQDSGCWATNNIDL